MDKWTCGDKWRWIYGRHKWVERERERKMLIID